MAPWIETARAYRAVSLEQREGHVPIPVMFGIDAVHGNNNVIGAVIFPHNIGLGAANDPALIQRVGAATAAETAAAGFDWAFGPTLAVPQNDGWGRAYEGYSEDPGLVRRYAGEMVRGLQGEPGAASPLPIARGRRTGARETAPRCRDRAGRAARAGPAGHPAGSDPVPRAPGARLRVGL